MPAESSKTLGIVLTVVFVVALILGPGPGMYLANRAEPLFGLPALYVWGLLWYVVEVTVVILAFLLVWPRANSASPAGHEAPSADESPHPSDTDGSS